MTSEIFKKAMSILTDQEIFSFAKRLCDYCGFDPAVQYPQKSDSEILSGTGRRILYMHRAANLLRRAIFLGGTQLDIFKISQYLVVLNNAVSDKLDFRHCEKELDIAGLNNKYSENEFLSLDIDEDELNQVINRDNNYYEVSIKNEDC